MPPDAPTPGTLRRNADTFLADGAPGIAAVARGTLAGA